MNNLVVVYVNRMCSPVSCEVLSTEDTADQLLHFNEEQVRVLFSGGTICGASGESIWSPVGSHQHFQLEQRCEECGVTTFNTVRAGSDGAKVVLCPNCEKQYGEDPSSMGYWG